MKSNWCEKSTEEDSNHRIDAVVEFVIWEQGFVFGEAGGLPKTVFRYGNTMEEIFVCYEELKAKYGKEEDKMPLGAVGVYSATEKIRVGLQQFMAGARKWKVNLIEREDLASLTE